MRFHDYCVIHLHFSHSHTDRRRHPRRRGSAMFVGDTGSPKLSDYKKGLAKSTTALNSSPSLRHFDISTPDLRGIETEDQLMCGKINRFLYGKPRLVS